MSIQGELKDSLVTMGETSYSLVTTDVPGERLLVVSGDIKGFTGEPQADQSLLCALSPENAREIRKRLAWLQPTVLGLQISAGFGDRLGIATPGHVEAVRGTGVAPIFAQQSVRENTRTGRTPQEVVDDAMWGAFEAGWREPWGADADHMKTLEDIPSFVNAGYTFFTVDPGDFVDDSAEDATIETLRKKVAEMPWSDLQSSLEETQASYLKRFELDGLVLTFDEHALLKAVAKYGGAVAHAARMTKRVKELSGEKPFEMEISVDETGTTTALIEFFYIAAELKRLGVPFVSLAPRFVGRFEKGVGYIGDLGELKENIDGHASIMRYFNNSYKLSLHTGSEKFEVYPLAMQATNGLVHLKTAGTSYLEALHLLASIDPPLFREILDFSRGRYETDRKTYHVSAILEKVPAAEELKDEELPGLFEQFDARQVLHVTFGSVLDHYGSQLQKVLHKHRPEYYAYIKKHFQRHLAPFTRLG